MRLFVVALALACSQAAADDLYVFWRPGCDACERLKAAMVSDRSIAAGYDVYVIDAAADRELAGRYRVKSVPTLVVLDEQKRELRRMTGYTNEASLRAWLDKKRSRPWRR